MPIRRYVLTGAPGAGKTTLIDALRERGHSVVAEAATDVIARRQAAGLGEDDDTFLQEILELQVARERAAVAGVVFFDRSPLCTLALARYLDRPVPRALRAAADRSTATYQREAFLVRPLGFVRRTAARRISYADSLRFAAIHEQVYRSYGFTLVDVPKAAAGERVALLERVARSSLG